jgi:hypothetical protein
MFNIGNIFRCPTTTMLGAIACALTISIQPSGNHLVDVTIASILAIFGAFSNMDTYKKP